MTLMLNSQDYKIISLDSMVDSHLNQGEDAIISAITVDIRSINWKEELKEKANCCVIENDDETKKQAEAKLKNKEKSRNKLK